MQKSIQKNEELILSFDSGTQSIRAALLNYSGEIIDLVKTEIEPYFSERPGWAEQNPEYYWEMLCKTSQELLHNTHRPEEAIKAVTITTQRGTFINLDKNGQPLRPAIVWLDQRRTEGSKPVGGLWGLAFKLARMTRTVAYLQAEAEANWIQTHQPDVWEKTYKYVLLSGYLTYRLTGRFVDSVACQAAYLPFDYKRQKWSRGYDWKWQAVPIDKGMLVDLIPPTEPLE